MCCNVMDGCGLCVELQSFARLIGLGLQDKDKTFCFTWLNGVRQAQPSKSWTRLVTF